MSGTHSVDRVSGGGTAAPGGLGAAGSAEAQAALEPKAASPPPGARRAQVAVLAPAFPPAIGGIEQLVYRLCRHARLLQPEVFTPRVAGAEAFDVRQPFRIRRTHPWLPRGVPGRLALSVCGPLLARLSTGHVSLVLSAHISTALPALLAKRLFGVPYVLYCHGSELCAPTRRRADLYRALIGQATCVIAISHYTRRLVEQLYEFPCGRIPVVPPGVDTREFHPGVDGRTVRARYGLEEARVALTVGRLSAAEGHKAHDRVIEALPEILHRVPEARYLVVGGGDGMPRLRALAERAGVSEQVIFAGSVSQQELPAHYAAADVYVMPSRHLARGHTAAFEGFGMVFTEAAAAGLPVIGGRTGGVHDAVADNETGMLIDPEQPDQLIHALTTLLSDHSLAARMGAQGRERTVQKFSCEAVVAQFESVVLAALSPSAAAAGPAQ